MCIGLLPILLLFNSTIYTEIFVGKFFLFSALLVYGSAVYGVTWKRIISFSIVMTMMVLFRQGAVFLFPCYAIWYILHKGGLSDVHKHALSFTKLALPSILFIGVSIFYWSGAMKVKYGAGYYTTTSTDLSFMVRWGKGFETLGDPQYPSVWRRLNEHYLLQSRQQNITFKEAVMKDKRQVWKDLTWSHYLSGLKSNIIRFFSPRNAKIKYILIKSKRKNIEKYANLLELWNAVIVYFILSLFFLFLIFPKIIKKNHRKLLSLFAFSIPFIMIHLFMARANARHGVIIWWTMIAIASVVLNSILDYWNKKDATSVQLEEMSVQYKTIVGALRVFTTFIVIVLLLCKAL